jgi:hypothetical protein
MHAALIYEVWACVPALASPNRVCRGGRQSVSGIDCADT